MASASTSSPTSNQSIHNTASVSHFQKTVCLEDWWLIKVETDSGEKRLAVAGLTSREQQARRVFSSAPIHKRYDVFTLETIDGVFIIIKGFINKPRTEENGFPADVFNHFVFGFPPDWEEYAEKWFGGGFTTVVVSRSNLIHDVLSTHSGTVASKKDCSDATPKKKKFTGEERHDSDSMNVGLEDSGIILSAMAQYSPRDDSCNKVSSETRQARPSQVVSERNVGDAVKGSDPNNNVTDFLSRVEDKSILDIGSNVSSIGVKDTGGGCSLISENEAQDEQLKSAVAHVESESEGKSSMHVSSAGFQEPTDDVAAMDGKNTNESVKSSIRTEGTKYKDDVETTVDKKERSTKEASSRMKPKRKLTYGTPIAQEQKETASVVSPGSLSFKRSRSGRLLLPSLEFWRNQTAIYDADRHITGIQEGLPATKLSRGSRSEPQRKRKELA